MCSISNQVYMDVLVGRTCGNLGTVCSNATIGGKSTTTCGCEGDLCNSAGTTTVSMIALIAPLLVPKLFN